MPQHRQYDAVAVRVHRGCERRTAKLQPTCSVTGSTLHQFRTRAIGDNDTNQRTRLDNAWAVVTGSTSGIGRAIALELAAAGANVVVHGRDQQRADEVCAAIRELKREAVAVVTDLADAVRTRSRLSMPLWRKRPIDIWVNNAGADVLTGDAADWPFRRKARPAVGGRRARRRSTCPAPSAAGWRRAAAA